MRVRSKKQDGEGGGAYFAAPKSNLKFVRTGCSLLDLVIGGGYPLGRMVNIIGDKSTGKTLLAIEACANFIHDYPKGLIAYREVESAFDQSYARALGMPVDEIDFGEKQLGTIEEFAKQLQAFCKKAKAKGQPGLFILDSMDALSDEKEAAREFGEASFGTGKAKANSELFRRLTRDVEEAQVCLIIISQIRDNIGAMFGDKTTRSGGRALDFYASQCIKLAHLKQLVATRAGVKRVTGVRIKARCTKNKIGLPFRECEFVIRFAYGVESFEAGMEWLIEVKRTKELGLSIEGAKRQLDESVDWDSETYAEKSAELEEVLARVWRDIEVEFLPTRKKYG
jgi:recombination protein RecA